jgi:DNA-binding protein WhiA
LSQQRNVESFSAQTKEELLRTSPSHKGCKQAEMAAVIQACGSLVLTQRGLHLELISDHPALVRRMFGYCKQMTGQSAQLLVRQNRRLHKRNSYILRLIGRETVLGLLTELGLWQGGMMQGMPQTIRNTCCRRAYVRGLFLCCGSVTNPEKAYHLEWNCKEEALCQALYKQLVAWQIPAHTIRRKNSFVVYIKDGDAVAEMLAMMGANNAILQMENARIVRQMRNKANRAMNCDTANINKTMTAAAKQQACIRFLVKENRFETMNAGLKMAAETRLAYPEATLEELGELMEPRMGKSGVNHRMRKLVQMAEEMGFVFEEGMEV